MASKRVILLVKGNVVGVRFRDYVQKTALSYNLRGVVENQPDRTVKIICEGDNGQVDKFISELKKAKTGGIGAIKENPLAEIQEIEIHGEEPTNEYQTYTIKYGRTEEELGEQMGAAYGVLLKYDQHLQKLDEKYGTISTNISQSSQAIVMLASAINSFEKTMKEDRTVIKELATDIKDLMSDYKKKKQSNGI
jgi:acylphosphatase